MPTHAGAVASAEELTGLLLERHGRLRAFLALAGALAAGETHPAQVAETAAQVRRFGETLALHAADEEESILPRLAGRDRDVDAALVAMHRDHARHRPAVDRVAAICAELAARPARHLELAPALGDAARALGDHLAGHLAREEAIVFPAVRRYLPDDAQRAILAEVRARRRAPCAGAGGHSSR